MPMSGGAPTTAFEALMRHAILAIGSLVAIACHGSRSQGPPVRIVAGNADTVIINSYKPVRLPVQVLDAAGHTLPDSGVRFERLSGLRVPVSETGMTTRTGSGDAVVRTSLGPLVTRLLVRCRPVQALHGLMMMNLVAGGPGTELPVDAVDSAGRPVTILAGHATVQDSTIAMVEGLRIYGHAQGSTGLDVHIGDQVVHAAVHVYERVATLEQIRPGEHLAVPVHLRNGEMHQWRLPASPDGYFVTMIATGDGQQTPQLAITGAACEPARVARGYFCTARQDARIIAYPPQDAGVAQEVSGVLGVWHQTNPEVARASSASER
jgi:hypothetical protein